VVTYHDRLALVLYDVARSSNLVAAAQAQEHELVRGIYRVVIVGAQCIVLPFRRCHGWRNDVASTRACAESESESRAGYVKRMVDLEGGMRVKISLQGTSNWAVDAK
jgi:hypothetical protein